MSIRTDYHIHTPLCQHATGPLEACVEQAIELGLSEIGFSCHNPLPNQLGADVRMAESELHYYVARVRDLQFAYRHKIEVKLGLEMDFLPAQTDYLARQAEAYPWDYIIGSIHYLDDEALQGVWFKPLFFPPAEQIQRYYQRVRELVTSGLFDILGHFDVVKRAGHDVAKQAQATDINDLLALIADRDLCVEINTSGYRHAELPVAEPYPSWDLIDQLLAHNIALTVTSDAHAPEQVGLCFPAVADKLRRRGCRHLVRFDQRKRSTYDF